VIALITEWRDRDGSTQARSGGSNMGGTMRLGAQECRLESGSRARQIYGVDVIFERHRHRYEFNNGYLERLRAAGLVFAGFSVDGLVELIELPSHPWFMACQFHPEFRSNPRDGHPLFQGFVRAAREAAAHPAQAMATA
jgi:CTP synthase